MLSAGRVAEDAHLYKEKVSGTKREGRIALEELLSRGIRKGDTVVVTRLHRLARSTRDLHNIAHVLTEKGVGLRVLEQNIDTTIPASHRKSHRYIRKVSIVVVSDYNAYC